jgi:hypothetical protein
MSKLKKTIIANNFLELLEIKVLGKRFNSNGILAVLACYFAMSGSDNGEISDEELSIILEAQFVDDAKGWLKYCVEKNIISKTSTGYTNTHVQKDRKAYGIKLESDRNRKRILAESRAKQNGNVSGGDKPLVIDIDIDNVIDPNKEIYAVHTDQIKLTERQFQNLLVNYYNGNEATLREEIEKATDNRKARGEPPPVDCLAYMRNWKRTSARYGNGNAPIKKQTAAEKALAIGEKLTMEGL